MTVCGHIWTSHLIHFLSLEGLYQWNQTYHDNYSSAWHTPTRKTQQLGVLAATSSPQQYVTPILKQWGVTHVRLLEGIRCIMMWTLVNVYLLLGLSGVGHGAYIRVSHLNLFLPTNLPWLIKYLSKHSLESRINGLKMFIIRTQFNQRENSLLQNWNTGRGFMTFCSQKQKIAYIRCLS